MKLGVNTYTYMWSIGFPGAAPARPLSAMDLLEKTHALGLKVLQIGPNLPLDRLPRAEFDDFVRTAHEWGIELELGTRALEYDHLKKQIEMAAEMGATLLRTVPEVGGATPPAKDIPGHIRKILPVQQAQNVKLGLENGNIPAVELRKAIDACESPLVGIILDTTNSLAVSEGWKYVAEILAPYTMCLHLKEFTMKRVWSMMGFICEGRAAGQGQLDIPWLLDTVKASRYDFNVIIELWPPEQKTLEETIALEQSWAIESVDYMRQLIKD